MASFLILHEAFVTLSYGNPNPPKTMSSTRPSTFSTAGRDTDTLAQEAVARVVKEEGRFIAAVEQGIAAADRDEFIEETEMDARVERMLRDDGS